MLLKNNTILHAFLAQLDRALVYGTKGQGFESLRTHHYTQNTHSVFLFLRRKILKNIIVVDMQKGFITEKTHSLIEKINKYLKDNVFDHIFFTKFINDSKSPFNKILSWHNMTKQNEQDFAMDIPTNTQVLTKNCYGLSTDHINFLKNLGITEIEICGIDTDACCLAIAFNLFDNNIKPIILSTLCASSSENEHIHVNAIDLMKRQFGQENIKQV